MPYKLENPERLELIKARKQLAELEELCRKASACGFNFDAIDMGRQWLRDKVDTIEREFGTKRRE